MDKRHLNFQAIISCCLCSEVDRAELSQPTAAQAAGRNGGQGCVQISLTFWSTASESHSKSIAPSEKCYSTRRETHLTFTYSQKHVLGSVFTRAPPTQ